MTEPVVGKELSLTYEEAAELAFRLHIDRRFKDSEQIYRDLLQLNPGDQNVIHYLGVLMHQTGRHAEALEMIERSLAADNSVAAWHNNYGNALLEADRFEEAAAAYRRCTELDPSNIDVLCNLGVLYRCLKRFDEALVLLKQAMALRPDFLSPHLNLATLYWSMGRFNDAYEQTAMTLRLFPHDVNVRRILGLVFGLMGRLDEAADVYRQWLALEPDNLAARHLLAGCTGVDVPDRADQRYVEDLFDDFANSFDAKLAMLEYRAPQLVGEAVARLLPDAEKDRRVLDAGCGTGLCGAYLAPVARELIGVDLSAKMLELAAARGVYTSLLKADLIAYLASAASFELIVSADTLCYIGRLDEAIGAARHALCDDGLLIFTVEASSEEGDYRLHAHGRYSHRPAYVRATLVHAGFAVREFTDVVLRNEGGRPVSGVLIAATAAAGSDQA